MIIPFDKGYFMSTIAVPECHELEDLCCHHAAKDIHLIASLDKDSILAFILTIPEVSTPDDLLVHPVWASKIARRVEGGFGGGIDFDLSEEWEVLLPLMVETCGHIHLEDVGKVDLLKIILQLLHSATIY